LIEQVLINSPAGVDCVAFVLSMFTDLVQLSIAEPS